VEKVVPQKLATFDIFKQLTDVNNHPMYENSPNLVTLTLMKKKTFFSQKRLLSFVPIVLATSG
jgi:hypothetical protein